MARKYADRLPEWERAAFIQIRGQVCQYCGAEGDRWRCNEWPWEVDHIVPMQYGGEARNWSNLALACHPCNVMKSDALLAALPERLALEEWAEHAARMLAHREAWPA